MGVRQEKKLTNPFRCSSCAGKTHISRLFRTNHPNILYTLSFFKYTAPEPHPSSVLHASAVRLRPVRPPGAYLRRRLHHCLLDIRKSLTPSTSLLWIDDAISSLHSLLRHLLSTVHPHTITTIITIPRIIPRERPHSPPPSPRNPCRQRRRTLRRRCHWPLH